MTSDQISAILPPPGFGTPSFATPPPGFTTQTAAMPAGPAPAGSQPLATPVSWGPVDLHASLAYQFLYGTGLLGNQGNSQPTVLQTITPQISLNLGKHWSLVYVPSAQIYSSSDYRNTVNQFVSLNGWATWESWRLTGGYSFSSTDDPLIQTGTQTQQTAHNLQFGAQNEFSDRWSYNLNLSESIRLAQAYNDTYTTSLNNWLDYKLRPRLSVGVGVGLGYTIVDPGTDMPNQSISTRLRGRIASKFSYEAELGVNFQQFLESDRGLSVTPLVNASLSYAPTSTTALSCFANHSTGVSYYSFTFTTTTGVGAALQQQLLPWLAFSLTGGYQWTTYGSTLASVDSAGTQDYGYVRPSLSTRLFHRIAVSVFYQYSQNRALLRGNSFDGNQVGFSLSAGF